MPRTAENEFGAAVLDKEDRAVAFVEVKVEPVDNWATVLTRQLANFDERDAFILTVDLNCIQLYKPVGQNLGEPIVRLDSKQVLQHYDPEFGRKRVFEFYLLTLVLAWLRDLAYHWKSENPPSAEELRRAGLLEKFEGGTTQRFGD